MNLIKSTRTLALLIVGAVSPVGLLAQTADYSIERQTNYGGHSYVLILEPLNHENAVAFAAGLNGYLAIPDDSLEQSFLVSLSSSNNFWLGLHRDRPGFFNRTFLRDTDNLPTTFTQWLPGEPNNGSYIGADGVERHNPIPGTTNAVADEWLVVSDGRGWNDVEVPDSYKPPGTPYLKKTIVEIPPFSESGGPGCCVDVVAYYPFNGNANDASGNGNHGVVFNATPTADRFGLPASAYDFNGTNSYISITQNPILNALTTNLTLSAWIWERQIVFEYRIIDKCPAGLPGGWTFDTVNCSGVTTNPYVLRLQGAADRGCNVSGETDYSMMQWHHVVATVSGTVGKVYLDGNLDGSGDVGNIPMNALDVFIGSAHPSVDVNHHWFNGVIDDVRIYSRALSASEVQELYAYESGPRVALLKAVKPSFSHLTLATNYLLQVSSAINTWTNHGTPFTATNTSMVYPQYWDVDNWGSLFFRIQQVP